MSSEDAEHVGKRFGRNLVRARGRTDLSQEELGYAASLHRTEIGLLERGERVPRIDTLVKLAAALEVPASDLLDGLVWEPGTFRPGGFASEEGGRPSAED